MLGYIATFFVVGSFFLSGERNIRYVNSLGAILFMIYGMLNRDVPVVMTNSFIFIVHMYKIRKKREYKFQRVD